MRELLPEGIGALWDVPYKLADAIYRALVVLSWENLPNEDRPPENIWADDRAIREWFKGVEQRRGSESGKPDSQIDDPVENAAAKGLIVGH